MTFIFALLLCCVLIGCGVKKQPFFAFGKFGDSVSTEKD
jgi:hypothetical protein